MPQIKSHFKDIGVHSDVKYIDPTYMLRAVRANASDAILCTVLGQNAVRHHFSLLPLWLMIKYCIFTPDHLLSYKPCRYMAPLQVSVASQQGCATHTMCTYRYQKSSSPQDLLIQTAGCGIGA